MSNLKALNARSETLLRASSQVDKAIAQHLVAIAKHVNGKGNGDVSAVNYFWSILTAGGRSGLRHDAIGDWLLAYAGVTWNAEKKRYNRKREFQFSEQLATENPWYLFKRQTAYKPFDLEKALAALVKRANTRLEDTSEDAKKDVINKETLRMLEEIVNKTPKPLPKSADVVPATEEASEEVTA